MLLHLVADFGPGDLAFAEVVQRLHLHLPEPPTVMPTPVPPFATLTAGFCVAQLALTDAPPGAVVFHNVAPRRDDAAPRRDQAGEGLAFAATPTGVRVVGVDAGHAFSFLAAAGVPVRRVAADAHGSQFRSRDVFPAALARVLAGDDGALGEPIASIPPVPEGRVAYVDGFGNLKTTWRRGVGAGALEPGSRVRVTIGGCAREATVAGGGFGVAEGELAFSAGSSGWGGTRWMELFLRGGSAAAAFGGVAPAAEVRVEALE